MKPEPEYSTWIDVGCDLGLVEREGKGYRILVEELIKPIPSGIAKRLGIKPKEA